MELSKTEAIRRCHLFAGIDPASLAPLAEASSVQSYAPGATIFMAGDEADGLRVVLSGQVRIWMSDREGHELTLAFLDCGDSFGEIALLDTLPRTACATAREATVCLFLPASAMQTALSRDPELARHLVLSLCELLRRNLGIISGFAFVDLGARLARKLHELATDHAAITGKEAHFSRRFSQTDLAQLLGVSREAVNKRLRGLEHDGLVAQDKGQLVILDLPRLARRAEAEETHGM